MVRIAARIASSTRGSSTLDRRMSVKGSVKPESCDTTTAGFAVLDDVSF